LGVMHAILRTVTFAVLGATAVWALAKVGLIGFSGALKTAILLLKAYKTAQLVSAAASAIASVAVTGLVAAGIGLTAWYLTNTDGGKAMLSALANVFVSLKDYAVSAFTQIASLATGSPTFLSDYFADVGTMASDAFNAVASAAKVGLDKAIAFFKDLWGTATQTFAGISDAIAAGNIQLAMNVLWAGLKVVWVKGTDALKSIWSTSMIYITGALDQVGTSLKMIWDVTMIYLEGAFDKFVLYIRNAMQDASTFIGQSLASIDPTGYLGDKESIQEEDAAQRKVINKDASSREADRNKRLANT
jgi:hypothetical protein